MKWKKIRIERIYKSGKSEIKMQINEMFKNLSQVPPHHKKLFQRKYQEDPFFTNLNSLLNNKSQDVSDDLIKIKKRFELEEKFLEKINNELSKAASTNKASLSLEFNDEKILKNMEEHVKNIGYIYICFK